MITDLVVWGSVAFTLVFVGVWAASPALRVWIERPKHQFLDDVQRYDRASRQATEQERVQP